jgi:hypothetical protein
MPRDNTVCAFLDEAIFAIENARELAKNMERVIGKRGKEIRRLEKRVKGLEEKLRAGEPLTQRRGR